MLDGDAAEIAHRPHDRSTADTFAAEWRGVDGTDCEADWLVARLQHERARAGIDMLNEFGLPAALLNTAGQVLYANPSFDSVDVYLREMPNGRLSLKGNDALRKAFAQALERSAEQSVTLAVPHTEEADAAVITFMPVTFQIPSSVVPKCTIMTINPVSTNRRVPCAAAIEKLFGLTPAEARIASALAAGLSVRDSAEKNGISLGTARSYLIRVFAKTGTNQQSELVSLLKSVPAGNRTLDSYL